MSIACYSILKIIIISSSYALHKSKQHDIITLKIPLGIMTDKVDTIDDVNMIMDRDLSDELVANYVEVAV